MNWWAHWLRYSNYHQRSATINAVNCTHFRFRMLSFSSEPTKKHHQPPTTTTSWSIHRQQVLIVPKNLHKYLFHCLSSSCRSPSIVFRTYEKQYRGCEWGEWRKKTNWKMFTALLSFVSNAIPVAYIDTCLDLCLFCFEYFCGHCRHTLEEKKKNI